MTPQQLAIDNLKLTHYFANKTKIKQWAGYLKVEREDLLSIARVGLVRAANAFDVDKNYNFGVLACLFMRRELALVARSHKALKSGQEVLIKDSEGDQVKVASYQDKGINQVDAKDEVNHLTKKLTTNEIKVVDKVFYQGLSIVQVADELGISKQAVSQALNSAFDKCRREAGVDKPVKVKNTYNKYVRVT